MAIQFKCGCGQFFDLPLEMAGKKARCPTCGSVFVVPNGSVAMQEQPMGAVAPQDNPSPNLNPTQPQPGYPAFQGQPVGHPNVPKQIQAKSGSGNQTKIIVGSVVGAVLVIVAILFFVLRGGDKEKEQRETQVANGKSTTNGSTANSSRSTGSTGGKTELPEFISLPKSTPPKSKEGRFSVIANITAEGKQPPKMVISRNGTYLALSEDQSKTKQLGVIDLRSPRVLNLVDGYEGNNFKAISNDARIMIFENEGDVSIWHHSIGRRRLKMDGFPGQLSISEDSAHVMIDDGEKSIVANVIGYGFQWVQSQTIKTTKKITWSGNLQYGYFFDGAKIIRYDEKANKQDVHLDTKLRVADIVSSFICRTTSYCVVFTKSRVYFYDLQIRRQIGNWKRQTDSEVKYVDIANDGSLLAFARPVLDQRGKQGEEVVMIETSSGKTVDVIQTGNEIYGVKINTDGTMVATLSQKLGKDYFLLIFSAHNRYRGKQYPVDQVVFYDSIPEPNRWAADFKKNGFNIKGNQTASGETINSKNNVEAFLKGGKQN